MKTLFVNMAWDCAGVSIRQARAINKYTDWKARHFRACPTFGYDTDMAGERYNKEELLAAAHEADVIHFCQYPHTSTEWFNFGFDWADVLKGKRTILHDYALFSEYGYWKDFAADKRFWNRKQEVGYSDIWSSAPMGIMVYDECYYMPDIVDETDPLFNLPKSYGKVVLGHFPTGGENRKNTTELMAAVAQCGPEIECVVQQGLPNSEIMATKQRSTLGFDAISRGFHGMTTVENLAAGVPTMVNIDPDFVPVFNACFKTTFFPFEQVASVQDIVNTITRYARDLEALKRRGEEVQGFMRGTWSARNVAQRIVERYEALR